MKSVLAIGPVVAIAISQQQALCADAVQFSRDVRPILATHCWKCHGPDSQARRGGLRLDVRDSVVRPAESGAVAVEPGAPEQSELIRRITTGDSDELMPPADSHDPLSASQIETLRRWIEQGAEYQRHWAFLPLERPTVPRGNNVDHPIDAFVQSRLKACGLSFAEEAAPERLVRRLRLTLTGLPPTAEELNVDLRRDYEGVVDLLLASPHFGEHLAVGWLDAARYADTNGYFGDKPRQMWLWRDWVIDAFNSNMPFDQFTIEQLAGDLLPNPTIQQQIATGFNRNHMANNETGIIDEEYRVEYVVDRVNTTLTTWMGLTIGCAQCHDHKYDPISQRDFYRLYAFFNNSPDKGLITAENTPPLVTVASPEQRRQLARLKAAATATRAEFNQLKPQLDEKVAAWEVEERKALPPSPGVDVVLYEAFDNAFLERSKPVGTEVVFEPGVHGQAARFDATQHVEHPLDTFDVDAPWSIGFWIKPDGTLSCLLSKIEPEGRRRGLEILLQKGHVCVNLVERWGVRAIESATKKRLHSRQWQHVVVAYDGSRRAGGLRVFVDGMPCDLTTLRDTLGGEGSSTCSNKEPLRIGRRDSGLGYYGLLDELRIVQRDLSDDVVAGWCRSERLRGIFSTETESRGTADREYLIEDYISRKADESIRSARRRMQQASQAERALRAEIPTTMVMQDLPAPRTTHVLIRGQYDQPGEVVQPGIPVSMGQLSSEVPRNRLALARWLVSNENPLTARVAVNRLWKQCFGHGLVRTMNDFGIQGELPTHPLLLDWLASEFRESGWDVKHVLRLIVTSRTFRQDSRRDDETFDPNNRLLARGPSYRMSAEMIRDQALLVSGLLRRRIGGPSVKPYQPPGLWEEVSYNREETYKVDSGDGLWRRGLYTWIKRQAPPPSFMAFDGATREKCTIQRAETNTPLQALILLNDPVFVEAARVIAARVMIELPTGSLPADTTSENSGTSHKLLIQLFRHILTRNPDKEEHRLLASLLARQRDRFRRAPDDARALLSVGEAPRNERLDQAELAAWTVVALTILNLDEAITIR